MVVLRKNQKKILDECLKLQNNKKDKIGILSCPLGFGKTIIGRNLLKGDGMKKELIITKEHLKKNWEGCNVISDNEFKNMEGNFDIVIFDDADILELSASKVKSKFIWMFSNNSDDFRYLFPIWEKNDRYVIKKGGNINNPVILNYLQKIPNIEDNIIEYIVKSKKKGEEKEANFFFLLELIRNVKCKNERDEIFKKYGLKYDIFETNAICPISGTKIDNAIITTCCQNKFSEKELINWVLDYRGNCPLCRNVIRDFEDITFTCKEEIEFCSDALDWNKKIMIYCNDEKVSNLVSKKWKLKNTNMNRINDFIKGIKNILVVSNIKVIRGINLKLDTILFYKMDNQEIYRKFKGCNSKLKSKVVFNSLQLFQS